MFFEEEKSSIWEDIYYFFVRRGRDIADIFWNAKYLLQKIFTKYHTSDYEIFEFYTCMAKKIYPKLKAFSEAKTHGYPSIFSEYDENSGWSSKEEYEKAIADGKIVGGGEEAWKKVLQEMLFAFEFVVKDSNKKMEREFMKKYGDIHKEIPENKIIHKWYKKKSDGSMMTCGDQDSIDFEEYEFYKDSLPFYYNMKLNIEHEERAQKGFELFGKYFQNMWD